MPTPIGDHIDDLTTVALLRAGPDTFLQVGLLTYGRARLYLIKQYPLGGWAIADQW